jgi:glycosyltransferase involved in cell wall biosynthesis
MKIGIHITTWNRCLFTEQCLKSLFWSKPKNIELLVIDNNSTDGTINLLKEYEKNNIMRVIYNDKNEGLGFAVNQGWGELSKTCDVLGWINNDFLFEPGWDVNVESCFTELKLDYIVGTVRPDRENIKQITSSGNGKYNTINDVGAAYFLIAKHFKKGARPLSDPFYKGYTGPGATFHYLLRDTKKFNGVRLAHPGILVRDSEYQKEYKTYYEETCKIRGMEKTLQKYINLENSGGRMGWINWNEFIDKYYPEKKEN